MAWSAKNLSVLMAKGCLQDVVPVTAWAHELIADEPVAAG